MIAIQNVILIFPDERPVFLREQANKMYSVLPYFIAKNIMDIPVLLITPLSTSLINYFAFGLYLSFS
jgi:ATP-binding cassette subfamily G (WHITE) protein 2